jgi:glutamine synthetase
VSAEANLARHWPQAIDRFAQSSLTREYFGERMVEIYCAVKRAEAERYYGEVPQQDYDWYLRTV